MTGNQKLALVTGGNRGLGFETSRQLAKKGYRVLLTSRNEAKGRSAAEKLKAEGLDVEFLPLDVSQEESVRNAEAEIRKKHGRLDALINNAGVMLDVQRAQQGWDEEAASALKVPVKT